MTPRIQIVARFELGRRVREAAQQQRVSVNAFLIAALERALAEPRAPPTTSGA